VSADALAAIGLALGLCAGGAVSGLVPVINAEALLVAAVVSTPDLWLVLALSLTVGQCSAKVLIYLAAREGPARLRRSNRVAHLVASVRSAEPGRPTAAERSGARARRYRTRLLGLLGTPLAGTSLVAVSASVGFPPLAVVSAFAGTARLRLALFVPACLVGRMLRFAVIAWPVAHLLGVATNQATSPA